MEDRRLIIELLYKIIINKKFSHDVLNEDLYKKNINYSLIKKEISGVIENKLLIEYLIKKYSKTKLEKIDKKIYIILLSSIYELLFLDIASYATINEYVEISKKLKGEFLSKYVNAILRNIYNNENLNDIFNVDKIPINIKYSIPINLYQYIIDNINIVNTNILNKELIVDRLFNYYNTSKLVYLRINDNKYEKNVLNELSKNKIEFNIYDGSLIINHYNAYAINNINNLNQLDCIKNNYATIQDISSVYFIDKLYDYIIDNIDNADIKILDSCSSPGGKTISLYTLLYNNKIYKNVKFYSLDKNNNKKTKIDINIKNISQDNAYSIITGVQDATKLNEDYLRMFDVVILDVPCSCLGIISKKSDIKYNFNIENIDKLLQLQKNIIDNNIKYLKNNSLLAISTCTINKKENIDNIKYILDKYQNFKLLYEEQIISDKNNKSDGFYFAILKKYE